MAFELTRPDVDRLQAILKDLVAHSEADGCVICDQAGHVLAQQNIAGQDPLLISALGAGVFAATRELARILGEDEFSTVLHQGEERSILIAAANEEVLIVVLFTGVARIGLVKLYTPTAATAIRAVFEDITSRGDDVASVDRNFVLSNTAKIFRSSGS